MYGVVVATTLTGPDRWAMPRRGKRRDDEFLSKEQAAKVLVRFALGFDLELPRPSASLAKKSARTAP